MTAPAPALPTSRLSPMTSFRRFRSRAPAPSSPKLDSTSFTYIHAQAEIIAFPFSELILAVRATTNQNITIMELYIQIITSHKNKDTKTIRFKSPYEVTKRTMLKTIREEAPSLVALAIKENDMPFIADYSVHFVDKDGRVAYVDDEHTACITFHDVRALRSPCVFRDWDFEKQKHLHPYWVMEYAMFGNPE